MRGTGLALLLLLLLAACSGGARPLDGGEPGLNVALAAMRGGSPQVALQVTDGLLAHDPNNESALIVQGDALTTLGRLEDAAASYTKVLARDPLSVGAHIGLGRIRLGTNPAQAEALFLEALRSDPRNTTALNDLGIARDLQGHHATAQDAYSKALGIAPELHAAQVNLALSLAMSGDTDQAVHLLQPLAEQPGASRKLRHDLAAVLTMAGDRAAAERILSVDLSPAEVQQALQAYASARSGAASTPLLAGTASGGPETPAMASGSAAGSRADVQLAAAPTEAAVQAAWQRLREHMPTLLVGKQPIFLKADRDGGTVWRLRVDGFTGLAEATAFCQRIRAAGAACMPLSH